MKIFVSSTVYDLVDIRAELKALFDQLEIESKFSDMPDDSKFTIDFQKSSIESCLGNIDDVDYFICIIDRRYGSSLKGYGYGDFSATHLEYKTAVKKNKKIIFCIRRDTFSECALYEKNKHNLNRLWVKDDNYKKLFNFINEHKKLSGKNKNNWCFQFADSIDLKKIIKNNIEQELLAEKLTERIAYNELPNLIYTAKFECLSREEGKHIVHGKVTNKGKTSAFINKISWISDSNAQTNKHDVLTPNESMPMTFYTKGRHNNFKNTLLLDYNSYDGINIYEEIEISCHIESQNIGFITSVRSNGKKYSRSTPVKIDFSKSSL
jgi:hypothetical protein